MCDFDIPMQQQILREMLMFSKHTVLMTTTRKTWSTLVERTKAFDVEQVGLKDDEGRTCIEAVKSIDGTYKPDRSTGMRNGKTDLHRIYVLHLAGPLSVTSYTMYNRKNERP